MRRQVSDQVKTHVGNSLSAVRPFLVGTLSAVEEAYAEHMRDQSSGHQAFKYFANN